MNIEQNINQISDFSFEGKKQPVSFVQTMRVTEGVACDVYTFIGDSGKDLGIIRISPGRKTPLQRILKGERTIEGYVSGKGKLTITKLDGQKVVYIVGDKSKEPIVVTVGIGELIQWEAEAEVGLVAYEICFPPYKEGRYENIK